MRRIDAALPLVLALALAASAIALVEARGGTTGDVICRVGPPTTLVDDID